MDKIDKGFRVSVGTFKAGVPVKDLDKEVNWCPSPTYFKGRNPELNA